MFDRYHFTAMDDRRNRVEREPIPGREMLRDPACRARSSRGNGLPSCEPIEANASRSSAFRQMGERGTPPHRRCPRVLHSEAGRAQPNDALAVNCGAESNSYA